MYPYLENHLAVRRLPPFSGKMRLCARGIDLRQDTDSTVWRCGCELFKLQASTHTPKWRAPVNWEQSASAPLQRQIIRKRAKRAVIVSQTTRHIARLAQIPR